MAGQQSRLIRNQSLKHHSVIARHLGMTNIVHGTETPLKDANWHRFGQDGT
jgi:hypothetical protein